MRLYRNVFFAFLLLITIALLFAFFPLLKATLNLVLGLILYFAFIMLCLAGIYFIWCFLLTRRYKGHVISSTLPKSKRKRRGRKPFSIIVKLEDHNGLSDITTVEVQVYDYSLAETKTEVVLIQRSIRGNKKWQVSFVPSFKFKMIACAVTFLLGIVICMFCYDIFKLVFHRT